MVNKLEIIQNIVAKAKSIPVCKIEYNFDELPKDKEIKKDSFYGIPAFKNPDRMLNTANIIYKLQ